MLRHKQEKVNAGSVPVISNDTIKINSGSFVIDNSWVSFSGTILKIKDYIKSVVVGNRTRFFKDREYAVYLLICLDLNEGIKILEGTHVRFTTLKAVPLPEIFDSLPLIGLILIQDGTRDLIYGFKPINNKNIEFFSGTGNILDKNIKGKQGESNPFYGETGIKGYTGISGDTGLMGNTGLIGVTGRIPSSLQGMTGYQGMTGMYWDIHIPFEILL
jgi:hypothetical protein